jgi:hypothetical protein
LSAVPIKLVFGDVLSERFRYFFANLRLFFHLVTIPWIISIVLRIVGAAIDDDSLVVVLAEKAADVIPTVMFLVAWMRGVLLGPHATGQLPGLSWSPRETAFLVHLLKVAGITFALLGAFVLAVGTIDPAMMSQAPIDPDLARRQALAAPFGTAFMISAFLALRVSFGLAATAVDLPFTPRQSWSYSRGNGWKIVGMLFLMFFMSALATMVAAMVPYAVVRGIGAGQAAAVLAWTVAILVTYAGAGIVATAQAIIFRTLTGWRPGAELASGSSIGA